MAVWSRLSLDADADGQITIRDLVPWVQDAFFLPGDLAIELLIAHAPRVAQFFEIGPDDVGTPLAKGIAIVVWLVGSIGIAVTVGAVRRADYALTAWMQRGLAEIARMGRVARRRIAGFATSWRRSRSAQARTMVVETVELGPIETAVLRRHSGLDEVAILSTGDVAAAMKIPERRAQSAFRRLRELGLLERGFGTDAGRDGHRITRLGQMFLIER